MRSRAFLRKRPGACPTCGIFRRGMYHLRAALTFETIRSPISNPGSVSHGILSATVGLRFGVDLGSTIFCLTLYKRDPVWTVRPRLKVPCRAFSPRGRGCFPRGPIDNFPLRTTYTYMTYSLTRLAIT